MSEDRPSWRGLLAAGIAWLALVGLYLLMVGQLSASEIVVALQMAQVIVVLAMILMALGYERSIYLDVALFGPLQLLRQIHSGYVGDCVVWLMLGSGVLLAVLTLGVRPS